MGSFTVGRAVAVIALGASPLSACGGHSERLDAAESDAGEPNAGRGGTGSAAGGTASAGGVVSRPGGFGGVSGSAATECGECPSASYGLLVEGDGEPYEMKFNGQLAFDEAEPPLPAYPDCVVEPLRGTVTRCAGAVTLRACSGRMNDAPCLEVLGKDVRYMDRQELVWTGFVLDDRPNAAAPGVSSGTLLLELYEGTEPSFMLTVAYTFCTPLGVLNIPC